MTDETAQRDQKPAGAIRPELSVVVVVFNMPREAPRTLLSLSAGYQRHINADDYEVIVVDNGSTSPLDPKSIEGLSGNFRLIRIDHATPSPVPAVNRGIAEARGDVIGVMIDGARIATPDLLHFARQGARLYERAVVATLGWYLGADFQRNAITSGYNQAREDALLESIGWPKDGYRLFEIATPDDSSVNGWLLPIGESNALFLRRELWQMLGDFDERFDAPGGGLANLDTYRRAIELPDAELVLLLGEATFHQFHDGISTNASTDVRSVRIEGWLAQYESIRGRPYQRALPTRPPTYLGTLPPAALLHFVDAAINPLPGLGAHPLGPLFDHTLMSIEPSPQPADPVIAALVDLAQREFRAGQFLAAAAVARLTRQRAPDEPEPRRLLSLLAMWATSPAPEDAYCRRALGDAHRILSEDELARSHYRAALELNADYTEAHVGLAAIRMPGPNYSVWLHRIYTVLAPPTVIEIGVFEGGSLAQVQPPSLAIGVDPSPRVRSALRAETHIFVETSDAFFARRGPDSLLAGRPLGVGFIDGLHLFEQALRDFINLETYCGPQSIILLHDTVPLDDPTQTRTQSTGFYTGDVWKVVLALKHFRPDLDVVTVATGPTGLTIVTGFDPSRKHGDWYQAAVARFVDTPFGEIEDRLTEALNIVANDWPAIEQRLKRVTQRLAPAEPTAGARLSRRMGRAIRDATGRLSRYWTG